MTLLVLIGLLPVAVLVLRAKVTFFVITIAQLILVFVGLVMFNRRGEAEASTAVVFGVSVIVLAISYGVMAALLKSRKNDPHDGAGTRATSETAVAAIVWFAGLLGSYHLLVSGIPILSEGIERSRFDFTSSGLLGVPGRMYIFGTTIAWIIASVNAHARGVRWRSDRTWRVASAFVVAHALLSGFKGELLSTILLFIGMFVVITGTRVTLWRLATRGWWAGVLGLAYFYAVATQYTTYQEVNKPLSEQLLDRATTGGAEAGRYAIEQRTSVFLDNSLFNDLHFLLLKYTGQPTGSLFTLDRLISSEINNASPTSSAFAPPVTIGGFPEITYSYGVASGLFAMFVVGALFAYFDARSARRAIGHSLQLVSVLAIYTWTLKGSLMYVIINYAAVSGILLAVGAFSHLMFRSRKRERKYPGTVALRSNNRSY